MYLSKQCKPFLLLALSLTFSCTINAQTSFCDLSSPDNIILIDDNNGKTLSWDAKLGADAYRVVVVDNEAGQILFDQTTTQETITLGNIFFTPDVYIGVATVCMNSEVGTFEYFAPALGSNIFVQDIVMQMQGEPEPRTLVCETEKDEIVSVTFSGALSASAEISPPFNNVPPYQIQGAIIEVSLYEASNELFAKSTTVVLSDGKVLHAANQINVEHNGPNYNYVEPFSQDLYSYSFAGNGTFEYGVNTSTPTPASYHLLIEQRNCYNVNKANRGGDGEHEGGLGLNSSETSTSPIEYSMERVTDRMELQLYPNPATDQIRISHKATNVIIRNGQGQVVQQNKLIAAQQTIDIGDWAPGIYYLEAITGKGTRDTLRFVKQ